MSDLKNDYPSIKSKIIGVKPIMKQAEELEGKINQLKKHEEEIELSHRQAEELISEAHLEAEQIKENAKKAIELEKESWKTEKEGLEEQAEKTGFERGLEIGREKGYQEYLQMIEQAAEVIQNAKRDYYTILSESEDMILHLGLEAASKILNVEVKSKDNYKELVKQAIKEVKNQTKVSIYSHPDDYQSLLHQKEELISIVHYDTDLAIYPDSQLSRGACVIETPYGLIEAGVESQLQELRDKLFNLSREEASES